MVIYMVCLVLGGPLNIISLVSTVRYYLKEQRFRTQFLLLRMHLNIADFITLFIYTLTQWHGGDLLCRVFKFFSTFSFYLNSFINSGIAIDRACNTYNVNSKKGLEKAMSRVKRMATISYLSAILLSIPQLFIFRLYWMPREDNFKQCTPIWTIYKFELIQEASRSEEDSYRSRRLFERLDKIKHWETVASIIHLLLVFWVPSFIITFSYVVVIYRLRSFTRKKGSLLLHEQSKSGEISELMTKPTCQKSAKMESSEESPYMELFKIPVVELNLKDSVKRSHAVIASHIQSTLHRATKIAKYQTAVILITYLTLWTPYNLMALISITAPLNSSFNELIYKTLPFLNALIVVNTVINPIIYGFFEKQNSSKK